MKKIQDLASELKIDPAEPSHANRSAIRPEPEEVRLQAARILASKVFSRAEQLRRFLSYTVEETLAGGNGRLKEYTIGLEVFGRDSSYDPRIDPVVRVQAMRLRSKLEEYYATAGKDDPVLIELTKGSYAPVFTARPAKSSARKPRVWSAAAQIEQRFHLPARKALIQALGLLILVTMGTIAVFHYWGPVVPTRSGPATSLRQITSDPGLTTDPAVSPDGRLIVYSSDRGGQDTMELWLQQTGSTESIPLTHDGMNNREPSFSPDGTRIVFRSDRDGGGIFIMPTLGGEPRLLASEGREPRFSPDGRWVAYWTGEPHTAKMSGRRVYTVAAEGGTPIKLSSPFTNNDRLGASFPNWLSNSRSLLLYGCYGKSSEWYVVPFEGGVPISTRLVSEVFVRQGLSLPHGSAASNLAVAGGSLIFSARQGDCTNLWRIRLTPGGWQPSDVPERLTFGTATEVNPSVGGRYVGFVSTSFDSDIWTLPIDANNGTVRGELRRIVMEPAQDTRPWVSDKGDCIAFVSDRTGIPELWLRNSINGVERKLTDGLRVDSPCMSRNGRRVAFRIDPNDPRKETPKIGIMNIDGANNISSYDKQGFPMDWTADGRQVLIQGVNGGGVLWEPSSGQSATILQPPVRGNLIFEASFSPGNRWIAFYVLEPYRRALYLAPFSGFTACPPSEWISLSDRKSSDAWPKWSPDGSLLYFLSDRDGHRCIWALRLDASGHPSGEARAVYHLHSARLSMNNLENHSAIGFTVQREAMVFALGELKGNIWMLTLPE